MSDRWLVDCPESPLYHDCIGSGDDWNSLVSFIWSALTHHHHPPSWIFLWLFSASFAFLTDDCPISISGLANWTDSAPMDQFSWKMAEEELAATARPDSCTTRRLRRSRITTSSRSNRSSSRNRIIWRQWVNIRHNSTSSHRSKRRQRWWWTANRRHATWAADPLPSWKWRPPTTAPLPPPLR